MITFEIPVPLSINRTYKLGIKYHKASRRSIPFMYLSSDAVAYKHDVYLLASAAASRHGFVVGPKDRLRWSLDIYPPNRKSDSDGGIKLTKDAIARALGRNDRCFVSDHTERHEPDKLNPRAVVTVWIQE